MIGARAFVSRPRIVETSKTTRGADVIAWRERRDRIHGAKIADANPKAAGPPVAGVEGARDNRLSPHAGPGGPSGRPKEPPNATTSHLNGKPSRPILSPTGPSRTATALKPRSTRTFRPSIQAENPNRWLISESLLGGQNRPVPIAVMLRHPQAGDIGAPRAGQRRFCRHRDVPLPSPQPRSKLAGYPGMRIKIVAEWRTRSPGSRFEMAGRRATTPGEIG